MVIYPYPVPKILFAKPRLTRLNVDVDQRRPVSSRNHA